MQHPVDLGTVNAFSDAGFPQFFLPLFAQIPRQERLHVPRNLAPGRRTVLEIPRQPFPGMGVTTGLASPSFPYFAVEPLVFLRHVEVPEGIPLAIEVGGS